MSYIKKNFSTILLLIVFFIGLSLLLYPSVSDYWNSMHQSRAIASYAGEVAQLDAQRYDALWEAARGYNAALAGRTNTYLLTEEQKAQYEALLDVAGLGVMGYVEVPSIKCALPIYHGTDEAVLQIAVGHLEWSSLPVGGESTHCVISGHRGLPSARLFTDLDKLVGGDIFLLRVLDEVLTYEVDQIRIVEPQEVDDLGITAGEDLCTLVTCTPYGINTHRLLVRGHRVENRADAAGVRVTADAILLDPLLTAPLAAVPMVLLLVLWVMFRYRKKK